MKIIIFPALTAFILNMVFTPVIIKLALKFNWYDKIDDRKIHTGQIPRLGGVGIFLSFIISFSLFYFLNFWDNNSGFLQTGNEEMRWQLFGFFFSLCAIFITGLIDDFSELRARTKLLLQLAVAASLLFSGYYFKSIAIPFTDIVITARWFCVLFTFFWFVGITNAVNLIDGMDGLAGGTSFISLFFLGIISYLSGNLMVSYIAFILMSSLLAFLTFNLPPARTFMGDGGSLFLGTALSMIPLGGHYTTLESNMDSWLVWIVILLYIVPIFDTLSAIFRRLVIKRIHFFTPDREHLHHKLLDCGLSTRGALSVIYSIVITAGVTALLLTIYSEWRSLILGTGILAIILIFLAISLAYKLKKNNPAR